MTVATNQGRVNQKDRTRRAILDACLQLIRGRRPVTMPDVAKAAGVSEATAYRYFPDLASLLAKALAEDWPTPEEAFAALKESSDAVERVAFATRFLLEGVAEREAVVRSMISATINRPALAGARPGIRFGLIDYALSPFMEKLQSADAELPMQLKRDLAVVMSAEALFELMDLCGLGVKESIDSIVRTARTLTSSAFRVTS